MHLRDVEDGAGLAGLVGGFMSDDSDSNNGDEDCNKTPSLGPFPTTTYVSREGHVGSSAEPPWRLGSTKVVLLWD